MSSMGESVVWSVPAMQTGQDDIKASEARLNGIYNDLNQQLAPMREFWQGQANEGYDAVQARWNDAMQSMLDTLGRIERALGQAIEIHSSTESAITNTWKS